MIRHTYRGLRFIGYQLARVYSWVITCLKLYLNNVNFSRDFIGFGIPVINIDRRGSFTIGKNFRFNSGKYYNMIGRQQPCYFIVAKNAALTIADNVGISATAIVCHNYISIGENVKIGGNTVIYDTDFHAADPKFRNALPELLTNVKTRPVIIKEGAFIGAHCTILKGVTIGINAIVGAGSVVNQSIPDGETWMGNPARPIKAYHSNSTEALLHL